MPDHESSSLIRDTPLALRSPLVGAIPGKLKGQLSPRSPIAAVKLSLRALADQKHARKPGLAESAASFLVSRSEIHELEKLDSSLVRTSLSSAKILPMPRHPPDASAAARTLASNSVFRVWRSTAVICSHSPRMYCCQASNNVGSGR